MEAAETAVLVVEDDSMVRSWIRLSLEHTEFRIAGEAGSAAEVRDLVERRRPDVLLVDNNLGGGVGSVLLRDLRAEGVSVPALIMTANRVRGFNEIAREAGAQGTLLKTGSRDEFLRALRAVADGETTFDERHPRRPPGQAALSPREREVLRLVAAGATNREIADALDVGAETVKTLLARVFAKLGVRRRAEAVSAAHQRGLL